MSTKGCICQRTARRWLEDGVCATCQERVLESQLTPVLIATLTGGTGLVLFRNPVGFDQRTKNHYGLTKGAADWIGFHGPSGRFVAVEMKTRRGRQSPEQVDFERLVTRGNCVYAICRTEADARELLRLLGGGHPSPTSTTTT